MKPEPIAPRLPKPLTDQERLFLRMERFRPKGAREFNVARKLERLGLGVIEDREFRVTPAGEAALSQRVP